MASKAKQFEQEEQKPFLAPGSYAQPLHYAQPQYAYPTQSPVINVVRIEREVDEPGCCTLCWSALCNAHLHRLSCSFLKHNRGFFV